MTSGWNRNDALVALLVGVLALMTVGSAFASDANRLRVVQVVPGGQAPSRPNAALVLAQEIRFRTAADVKLDRIVVQLGSKAIFDHPFLLWVGEGSFTLTDRELINLRTFLESGGTLLVDNAGEGAGLAAFDRALRTQMLRAFPGRMLTVVPPQHVLFRAFYKIVSVWGSRTVRPYLEALFLEGRIALLYSQNDLAGAWSRDGFGNWEYEAVPGGPAQRENAIRLGVNVVLYALLQDYKDEQAHVEYLFRKRRLLPSAVSPGKTPDSGH